jgi:hypothetical protein
VDLLLSILEEDIVIVLGQTVIGATEQIMVGTDWSGTVLTVTPEFISPMALAVTLLMMLSLGLALLLCSLKKKVPHHDSSYKPSAHTR